MAPPPSEATADVRVLLFAGLRERAGWTDRRLAVNPNAGITARALWLQLGLGDASPWPAGVRVAINQRFASQDQPLHPGDELAFLPPISGG